MERLAFQLSPGPRAILIRALTILSYVCCSV
jgi:hypothetical protein